MKKVLLTIGATVIFFAACRNAGQQSSTRTDHHMQEGENTVHAYTNTLINETSPYLLQHAHNPVNWYPWNEATLQKARDEQKMILISIGYSACHWCHVMEHESFEDTAVAALMNEHFICIKVDREERPDVDQVYMDAVQLLSGRGGWPLNCFAMPDGKPFYGGTYFPKSKWVELLRQVVKTYEEQGDKLRSYAEELTDSVAQFGWDDKQDTTGGVSRAVLESAVAKWKKDFDEREGGSKGAPKFPLPNNYNFLLRYGYFFQDTAVSNFVQLTLKKMAFGGIYDQAGGGFARYSTDETWKVPHFEKMLYDNAQLVSLYSEAFRYYGEPLYREIVFETLEFVGRELTAPNGAFYSALDADSEGEEGKFYIWTEEELLTILGDEFKWVRDYYNINNRGRWEQDQYILLRKETDEKFAQQHKMTLEQLHHKLEKVKEKLMNARSKRVRPGLDDKSLTSWNALMLKAYTDAYRTFGEEKFLKAALKNADFIVDHQLKDDGSLYHNYKNGKSTINGYLEDVCFTLEAFIALYEVTFEEAWLNRADQLAKQALDHYFDNRSGMFFFTSDQDPALIARKKEVNDNVIPASNSSMAKALHRLGHLLDHRPYLEISEQMTERVSGLIPSYASAYSNWGMLLLNRLFPFYEVAICGKDALRKRNEMEKQYLPNTLFLGSLRESSLPLLQQKFVDGETYIYVCIDKSCRLPVREAGEALKQIR